MNARSVVLVAILLVLSVALWAGIYYGTGRGYGGNNSGPASSPFNEFSATVSVNEDPIGYTGQVYSKLIWSSSGSLQGWILEGQVDYSQNGRSFRHVYSKGFQVYGEVVDGALNISGCDAFNQASILDTGYNTFVPEPLVNPKPTVLSALCPTCNAWNLMLSGSTFYMLEKAGIPQYLEAWDKVITVNTFAYGQQNYFAPFDPLLLPECNTAVPPAAGTPAPDNDTLTPPPAGQGFDHSAMEERIREENRLMEQEKIADLRALRAPGAPVKLQSVSIDGRDIKGPLGKVQQHLHAIRLKTANSTVAEAATKLQDFCDPSWIGDGFCDSGCNVIDYNWDNGDCCSGCCKTTKKYACGSNGYNCVHDCVSTTASAGSRPCLFLHGLGQSGSNTFNGWKPPGYPYFGHPSYWGPMESYLQGICTSFTYSYHDTNGHSCTDSNLYLPYYNMAYQTNSQGGVVFGHSMANPIMASACAVGGQCNAHWYAIGGPFRGSKAASVENALEKVFGIATNKGTRSLLSNAWGMISDPNTNTRDYISRTASYNGLLKGALCGNRPWGGGGLSGVALYAVGALVYQGWVCTGSFWGICYDWTLMGSDGLVGQNECQQYGYPTGGGNFNSWYIAGNVWGSGSGNAFRTAAVNHYDETGNMGDVDGCVSWIKNMARRG